MHLPRPVPVWKIKNKQAIHPTGITIHHSWSPTLEQWHGKATMIGTGNYYKNTKGWSAGPHFFVAIGSPHPENDGIWQGTPVQYEGIHAGVCNERNIGIEVVGNYDKTPWSHDLEQFMIDLSSMLLIWMGSKAIDVNERTHGHRECKSLKTCPGSKINMDEVRTKITFAVSGKEKFNGG